MKPGFHKVEVTYLNVDSMGYQDTFAKAADQLTLWAEASHTYVLRAERNPDAYRCWFVDKGMGCNQECLTPDNYVKMYLKNLVVAGC